MRQTLETIFGEVRSTLQGEPSCDAVDRLSALVVEAEATDRSAVEATWMPYIRAHLERWYTLRPWTTRWDLDAWGWRNDDPLYGRRAVSQRLLATQSALLGVLRGVSIYADKDSPDDEGWICEALRRGALERVEWLSTTRTGADDALIQALLQQTPRGLRSLAWMERERSEVIDDALLSAPCMERLEALTLYGRLDLASLRRLTKHVRPEALRHLELSVELDEAMMRQLVWSPATQGLRSLGLCYTHLHGERLDVLERAPALPHLEALTFISCDLSSWHIAALLQWEGMARVRGLMAAINDVHDEGLRELALHPRAQALRALDLSAGALTEAALEDEEVVCALGRMEELALWSNKLSTKSALTLARGLWPALRRLDLSNVGLSEEAIWGMIEGLERMPALEVFDLSQSAVSDALLLALVERMPPTLHTLSLWKTQLTDAVAPKLAALPEMRQLKSLHITCDGITEEGLHSLRTSPHTMHLFEDKP